MGQGWIACSQARLHASPCPDQPGHALLQPPYGTLRRLQVIRRPEYTISTPATRAAWGVQYDFACHPRSCGWPEAVALAPADHVSLPAARCCKPRTRPYAGGLVVDQYHRHAWNYASWLRIDRVGSRGRTSPTGRRSVTRRMNSELDRKVCSILLALLG